MIKIIACVTMLIDHIGMLFFTNSIGFRIIGRLSMPLFAYCLVKGITLTRNKTYYCKRVLMLAVISLIPHCLMIKGYVLNICFLWFFSIMFFILKDGINDKITLICLTAIFTIIIALLPIEYTIYGFWYVLIMYSYLKTKKTSNYYILWVLLHLIYFFIDFNSAIMQIFTFPALMICELCENAKLEEKPVKSNFIKYFYPLHLVVLDMIYYLI